VVALYDRLGKIRGEVSISYDRAYSLASFLKVLHVMGVQASEGIFNCLFYVGLFDKVSVGIGSDGKSAGDIDAFRDEVLVHLSKGCVLATDQGNISYADLIEPEDELCVSCSCHGSLSFYYRVVSACRIDMSVLV